jgi:hypothetical protein
MTRELYASFMTFDSRRNLRTTTLKATIMAAKTFLMTTQPQGGPQAQVYRTLIAGLNDVGQHLEGTPRHHGSPQQEVVPPGRNNAA